MDAALAAEGPTPADRPVWARAFNWEDHSDALTHPEARRIRKFRELAWKVGVQPSIETMERTKENWYRQAEADHVIPIILTAGGAMSARTKDLLLQLVFFSASRIEDSQIEAETRARLYGRISVLSRYATQPTVIKPVKSSEHSGTFSAVLEHSRQKCGDIFGIFSAMLGAGNISGQILM